MLDTLAVTRSAQGLRPDEDTPATGPTPRPGGRAGDLHPAGPFPEPAKKARGSGAPGAHRAPHERRHPPLTPAAPKRGGKTR